MSAWTFYILLLALPLSEPPQELLREPFAAFSSRAECVQWQQWWEHHHEWMHEYGITSTTCQEERRRTSSYFTAAPLSPR